MQPARDQIWIRFTAAGLCYALPLDGVAEVTAARRPSLIPFIPREQAGVIVAKGEPLPAVHAAAVLCGQQGRADCRHALVLERGTLRLGLLVEEVSRIERGLAARAQELPAGDETAPAGAEFVEWRFVKGERVGLVDLDALLGCVGDLLSSPSAEAQQRGEESWPSAF